MAALYLITIIHIWICVSVAKLSVIAHMTELAAAYSRFINKFYPNKAEAIEC